MSRFTINFDEATGHRIRGAAWHRQEPVTVMLSRAILRFIAGLEEAENNGEPFATPPTRRELLAMQPPKATVPQGEPGGPRPLGTPEPTPGRTIAQDLPRHLFAPVCLPIRDGVKL